MRSKGYVNLFSNETCRQFLLTLHCYVVGPSKHTCTMHFKYNLHRIIYFYVLEF